MAALLAGKKRQGKPEPGHSLAADCPLYSHPLIRSRISIARCDNLNARETRGSSLDIAVQNPDLGIERRYGLIGFHASKSGSSPQQATTGTRVLSDSRKGLTQSSVLTNHKS